MDLAGELVHRRPERDEVKAGRESPLLDGRLEPEPHRLDSPLVRRHARRGGAVEEEDGGDRQAREKTQPSDGGDAPPRAPLAPATVTIESPFPSGRAFGALDPRGVGLLAVACLAPGDGRRVSEVDEVDPRDLPVGPRDDRVLLPLAGPEREPPPELREDEAADDERQDLLLRPEREDRGYATRSPSVVPATAKGALSTPWSGPGTRAEAGRRARKARPRRELIGTSRV